MISDVPARTGIRATCSNRASARAARSLPAAVASRRSGSKRCWRRATTSLPSPESPGTRDLLVALGIDERRQSLPRSFHLANRIDATRVSIHQLIPKDAAGLGAIVPRHVVEPQQELLGHALQIAELRGHRRRVLSDGIAARLGAIEANALRVGAMVVNGRPVRARAAFDPRARVRSDDRGPSGDAGRAASCNRPPPRATSSSSRPRASRTAGRSRTSSAPILRRCPCDGQHRIPGEAPEGIPVRLLELRTAPVAIGADVGHAGDCRCARSC